ncbi:MAG: nuclear transport factor 2 family protein [Chloroflexi bacterium]|nr:nuclear transport factor 2 family protein [Chloroflexota bacterium]
MSDNAPDRILVQRYFAAMQGGAQATEEMVSLFSDDGEYIEPFSGQGQPTSHRGIAAIRAFFDDSFAGPLGHDVKLRLDRLDVDGAELRSEWTCEIPMWPAPMRGSDRYLIRDGKIARLEVTLHGPATAAR